MPSMRSGVRGAGGVRDAPRLPRGEAPRPQVCPRLRGGSRPDEAGWCRHGAHVDRPGCGPARVRPVPRARGGARRRRTPTRRVWSCGGRSVRASSQRSRRCGWERHRRGPRCWSGVRGRGRRRRALVVRGWRTTLRGMWRRCGRGRGLCAAVAGGRRAARRRASNPELGPADPVRQTVKLCRTIDGRPSSGRPASIPLSRSVPGRRSSVRWAELSRPPPGGVARADRVRRRA